MVDIDHARPRHNCCPPTHPPRLLRSQERSVFAFITTTAATATTIMTAATTASHMCGLRLQRSQDTPNPTGTDTTLNETINHPRQSIHRVN